MSHGLLPDVDLHLCTTDLQPTLEVAHILRGQGIEPTRATARITAIARDVLDEARALLTPVALYAILPVQGLRHQTLVLDDSLSFEGSLVTRALAGAEALALAVCTIGSALEERMDALFAAGDFARAMALDGAGTAAVGEIARLVRARICEEASARGMRAGMRASPGQEGWPLEQQRVLFDLLPAQQIGVHLTPSCLMLPRKSISFAVGLGPEMEADAVTCDFCSKRRRCPWRTTEGEIAL